MVIAYALDSFDTEKVSVIGEVTRYVVLALFTIMFLASVGTVNRGGSLYSLWYSLTYVQFLRYIPVIDLNQSDVFTSFFSEIFEIYNIYTFIPESTNSSISQKRFLQLGFKGAIFLNNAEEMLWAWGSSIISLLILMAFGLCMNSQVMRSVLGYAKYSLVIRVSLIVFFDIMTCAILQVYYAEFQGTIPFVSMLTSLMFLTISAVFVIFVPTIIKLRLKMTNELPPEKCLELIITLVGEFYGNTEMSKYLFYPLLLAMRALAALTLVILWQYPLAQVGALSSFQIVILVYIVWVKPFKYNLDNWFVFAAEIFTLLLIGVPAIYLLTDKYFDYSPYLDIACICIAWIGILICLTRYIFAAAVNGSWNELRTVIKVKNLVSEPTLDTTVDFKDQEFKSSGKPKKKVLNTIETEIRSQLPNEPYENLYRETGVEQGNPVEKNISYFKETNGESWKIVELKDPREVRANRRDDNGIRTNYQTPTVARNSSYGEGITFYPRIAAKYQKYNLDNRKEE
ncbi:unnamed protein product [Blepharisma stoltei]|uniref:Uncharacterized protein n=1 Tax=Blepharisma stoltei TaxID=1481888 RepID=A0AAU9IN44_9CILI|nr:unnamed protein product [Blepharisma stoltei]